MSFFPPVDILINVVAGEAKAKFAELNAELATLESRSVKASAALGGVEKSAFLLKAGLAVAAVALFEVGKIGVQSVENSEAAFARLGTAMKNTGNDSQVAVDKITAVAKSAVNLGFKVGETATALGTLVTATKNVAEAQHLTGLAMDLARQKHISLEEAAVIVARGTQGTAKAFKEMGITLDSSLPKQQAINKAFDDLQSRIGGQNQAYLKTFSGQMSILSAQMGSMFTIVGKLLIPVLEELAKIMIGAVKWVRDNQDALKALTAVVVIAYGVWKTYETTIILVNAVQKIQIALALASAEGIGKMKAAQLLLNDAMKANAIGLIVTGLIAVGAVFVYAWGHSETFRKVVIEGLDLVVKYVANTIRAFGGLLEIIANILTGPLQLFLKVLSSLPGIGGAAKAGLKLIRDGIEGIGNTADAVANKIESATKSIDKLSTKKISPNTTSTAAQLFDGGDFNMNSYTGATTTPKVSASTAAATKLKKLQDTIAKIYDSMNKDLADAITKRSALANAEMERNVAIVTTFGETMKSLNQTWEDDLFKLKRDYATQKFNLNRSYNDSLASADQSFADSQSNAERTKDEALIKLQRDFLDKKNSLARSYGDALFDHTKSFNDSVANLYNTNADTLAKIDKDSYTKGLDLLNTYNTTKENLNAQAAQQTIDLQKAAADKQASIIQKSVDLLTNAFGSATGINVGSIFASLLPQGNADITNGLFNQVKNGVTASVSWWGKSADTGVNGLLTKLKEQLTGAQDLAKNASALAAQGFSQNFIQQVVSQGPLIGNQMAQAILTATPEASSQLKDLYGKIQDVSENGVNSLANQMSTGTSLATTALTNEYAQVAIDLQKTLATNSVTLNKSLTDAQKTFDTAIAANIKDRSDKITEANKSLTDGLSAAQKTLVDANATAFRTLSEGLTDARKTNKDAIDDIFTSLNNSVTDAQRTLNESKASALLSLTEGLADAKTSFDTSLTDMTTSYNTSVASAQDTLNKALIASHAQFNTDVDALQKSTLSKLAVLQTELKKTADAIALASGKNAGVSALAKSPAAPYLANVQAVGGSSASSSVLSPELGAGIVVNQNITNTSVDSSAVTAATLAAMGYAMAKATKAGG